MDKAEILIAGGGIAGMAAAIAVAPRDTLLLERSTQWQEAGAGVQLGPNAVRALRKLGTWDAVEPHTSAPPALLIKDASSGRTLKRLDLINEFERRFGAPYRVAHRADLHAAMRMVAEGKPQLQFKLGEAVSDIDESATDLEVATANSGFCTKMLVAADGIHSTIRQQTFPGSQAVASGETLHRALLPSSLQQNIQDGECVNLWLFPAGHVVHYPAGRSGQINLVAVTPTQQDPILFFLNACDALQGILHLPEAWANWPALHVEPLATWAKGRTLLLGDAAHGTLPYLAQGAAMALEDAAALQVAASPKTFSQRSLQQLSADRLPRTLRLHNASLLQGSIYHASGFKRHMAHLLLANLTASIVWKRMEWLYKG